MAGSAGSIAFDGCRCPGSCLLSWWYFFRDQYRHVSWEPLFVLTLLWLVFGLPVSAVMLLMLMIREGKAAKVASYFYLTPPLTALLAWLLFDEQLTLWSAVGILVAVLGVYLVIRNPAVHSP
ncbi:MAG: EamA family transporter [Gammaproteobacteria bacterium]|nr:EamA family transporter [Gammaproteobacteria bacterium]